MSPSLQAFLMLALAAAASGCVPPPPVQATITPGVVQDDLVYAFKLESDGRRDDRVKVVMCHRFADPPCVTVNPQEITVDSYRDWRKEAASRSARVSVAPHQPTPPQPQADTTAQ